jgi:hypothetical protein
MKDIALMVDPTNTDRTKDHDLAVERHDLSIISDIDALAQHLRVRLWFFFSEWFLDTSVGIRYFEDVLLKNPDIPRIETLFKKEILETPGVNRLLEFSLTYGADERALSIEFKVDTDFGPLSLDDLALGA